MRSHDGYGVRSHDRTKWCEVIHGKCEITSDMAMTKFTHSCSFNSVLSASFMSGVMPIEVSIMF